MVCSACGYENQVGNRFCGMCGTPLPHRPLTIPGAQGTHSFTRVPLESAKPAERQPVATPEEETSGAAAPSRTGVLIEMPRPASRSPETPPSENSVPPAADIIPEVPLDEYVKSFHYVPPADPKEITMRGDAPVLQPEAAVTDPPANAPAGKSTAVDTSFAPTEDVRERLGLEDVPGEERRDRARFLDFSEPPPPPEKPATRESTIVSPSFLGLSDAPQIATEPVGETGKPARGNRRIWFAVAVFLVFAALGVLEWRSWVNQTNNDPVEVITMKIRDITHSNSQALQPGGSAATASKPEMQVEGQPKPQVQDQNATASPSVPSSTSVNRTPAALDANAGTNAASPPQNTTAGTGNQPRARQETTQPTPSSSGSGTQTATGQKATQSRQTPPPNTPKAATATETADVAQNPAEKPKSKPRGAQEADEEVPVEKIVPGEEELAKANNASDSAAAAAWLWKATAKGNPDAPVRLAAMYIKGDGVPRNCEQALVLLKTAAAKENARACNRLATLYNSGTCVQRNRVEAYHWLSSALAADPNSRSARQNRDLIWQQMTPEERAAAQQYR